jgi:hypothetical protein
MTVKMRNAHGNAMTGTGGYSVTLFHFPATTFMISSGDEGGPISAFGANMTGTISRADADPWTFKATAGDSIMIGLSKVGNTTYYPRFCLFTPTGDSMGCRRRQSVFHSRNMAALSGIQTQCTCARYWRAASYRCRRVRYRKHSPYQPKAGYFGNGTGCAIGARRQGFMFKAPVLNRPASAANREVRPSCQFVPFVPEPCLGLSGNLNPRYVPEVIPIKPRRDASKFGIANSR